ncbi:MAG: tRNA pseudouridine(38-40) synthase TruA, partial [Treponema sp.]|nr:tRNA pseudouridine(38-40) synthase TruA [Treponema sp.]
MSEQRNILLSIAYDGTDYSGWQRQDGRPGIRTIQGTIEGALAKIHGYPPSLSGSGRTDSGVHARSQRANFFSPIASMGAERFTPALNGLLPPDIRITGAEEVPPSFHARFDARWRTYRYFFIPRRILPHESRYALPLRRQPDLALLNGYCRLLRGEYDCTVFAAGNRGRDGSPFRYIYGASFFMEAG